MGRELFLLLGVGLIDLEECYPVIMTVNILNKLSIAWPWVLSIITFSDQCEYIFVCIFRIFSYLSLLLLPLIFIVSSRKHVFFIHVPSQIVPFKFEKYHHVQSVIWLYSVVFFFFMVTIICVTSMALFLSFSYSSIIQRSIIN